MVDLPARSFPLPVATPHFTEVRARFGLILLTALLTACSAGTPAATATPEPLLPTSPPNPTSVVTLAAPPPDALRGTVSIWLSWGPEGVRSLNELIRSFQSRHPEVDFAVGYVPPDELRTTLEQAYSEGELPSLFLAPSIWAPELLAAGMILDLSDQAVDQLKPTVHSLAWSQVAYRGKLVGLPIRMHGDVLYRNRELASVPVATVEGLVETARAFRGTSAVAINLDYRYSTIVPFALACGGLLVQVGAAPDLQGETGPCWLSLLQELGRAGPVIFNSDLDREAFQAGESGWLIESSELYESFAKILGEGKVAVDPWPLYEGTGQPLAGYVWTENLYFRVRQEPTDLEAAWAFAAFLLSAESQLTLSNPTGAGNLPVHAASFPLVGALGQIRQALLGGTPRPLDAPEPQYVEILQRAARAVSIQGTAVDIALRKAIEELADV